MLLNNLLVIIILISSVECVAQGCLKTFFNNSQVYLFVISVVCYVIVCYLLVRSYQFKSMGLVNCVWSGISVIFILMVGYVIFSEAINIRDIVGVILIIIGTWLILYDGPHAAELFINNKPYM
jgi:multidrug transporter EmrE-like cation transporter